MSKKTSKISDLVNDPNYNLYVLLQSTQESLASVRSKDLSKWGISSIEAGVLFIIQVIEQTGDSHATPAEISRWLFRKPNSISALLTRMEKKGLVRGVKDLPKKNLVRMVLTEKGHWAYDKSTDRACINDIVSLLTGQQRRQLSESLALLRNAALERLGMKAKPPFPHLG